MTIDATSPQVLVEFEEQVAVIKLNNPDKMNALSRQMRTALVEALNDLNADRNVGAIVLRGVNDRVFSSGLDLDEALEVTWDGLVKNQGEVRTLLQAIRNLDKPCVCAIDGVCVGGGFQMALLADWRIATAESRWGQPEVKVGVASIVGPYLIGLHAGHTHNMQLSVSGELVSGQRAFEMGLVTEIVEKPRLWEAGLARARALAELPRTAVRLTKARLREVTQAGFDEAYLAGVAAQLECMADGERRDMILRFRAKRQSRAAA